MSRREKLDRRRETRILKVIDTLQLQELMVAETAREHQVEIQEEIEVEMQTEAELRNQVRTVKKSLEEQQRKTDDM